jgi:DNA-damage-inducible protein J
MKDAFVRARIEPRVKDSAERILNTLGLSSSEAISLFYRQIVLTRGIPFEIKLPTPNEETIRTFESTDRGEDLTVCKDADDMFERLGI